MSVETRSSSALFKRAEQLKRWEESETCREPVEPKAKTRQVKFSDGCVFLAACAAGDKEEVIRLKNKGVDIDTANVDGLTALHQGCIDDNLDMVEFLVENGADVNRGDNEGWTPLHATASCGFISIAKFLIENGGDVAAVNNDGELPIDIAESDDMVDLLQHEINIRGIDCEWARNEEEHIMLEDARQWLNSAYISELPHQKTGATALHVATAKGYIKVMSLLIQAGSDVNAQDFDGWTPLHAAAHWAQREACEVLAENLCNMEVKNYVGQTAFDVADPDVIKLLEELKNKQASLQKDKPEIQAILHRRSGPPMRRRSSVTRMSGTDKTNIITKDASAERQLLDKSIAEEKITDKKISSSSETETESEKEETTTAEESESEKKLNQVNLEETPRILPPQEPTKDMLRHAPQFQPKPLDEKLEDGSDQQSWPRPSSLRNRTGIQNNVEEVSGITAEEMKRPPSIPGVNNRDSDIMQEVTLRRVQSFNSADRWENDKKGEVPSPELTAVATIIQTTQPMESPTQTAPIGSQVRRSFVPPVRDEESETQRKAHAKRVRETRRSTQGVALEDLKSADQMVKTKTAQTKQVPVSPPGSTATTTVLTATTAPSDQKHKEEDTAGGHRGDGDSEVMDRRPSWRLRLDSSDRNKFSLEDARSKGPDDTTTTDATVTIPLRRHSQQESVVEDKEQDKENDSKNALASQAAIQRRKRPKRRSTGVVQVDMDEIDPEKHDKTKAEDSSEQGGGEESISDRAGRATRTGSGFTPGEESVVNSRGETPVSQQTSELSSRASSVQSENGEIDYKKLYFESQAENERLREKFKICEKELLEAHAQLGNAIQLNNSKNSISDAEKRERRALERKLSEMEEELKQLQKLKAENEKLKAENRALTRVVSKLTNTAK